MHQSYSKNIFLLQIKIISSALAKIKITTPAHAQTLSRQLTPASLAYATLKMFNLAYYARLNILRVSRIAHVKI